MTRSPLTTILCLLGGILFSTVHLAATPPEGPQNLVIILADDLGYGDVAGFGFETSPAPTPHLDRLGEEGARLTRFYTPTPYCAPSRAALLTGRYPYHTGVFQNPAPDAGLNSFGIPAAETTLGEVFQAAGYMTACIGKWHLGHTSEYLPIRHGFDEYLGILYSNDMRPVQLIEQDEVVEYPVVQSSLTERYTRRAIDFIERAQARKRPFFLYLPHAMPHKPLAASEAFWTPETPGDLYEDVLRELDASTGRIVARLEELGIAEHTLLLFLSDNGAYYGGSTGGLRGRKGTTWEGGLRVPFIAWQPGTIPAGISSRELAGVIDLFPTVLKQFGLKNPGTKALDGRDIWPLLTQKGTPSPHEAIYSMRGERLCTVASGPWRLHVRTPGSSPTEGAPRDPHADPRGPDGVTIIAPWEQAAAYPGVIGGDEPRPMMLFNVIDDPAEQHDVSADHPEVVESLLARFRAEEVTVVEWVRVPSEPLHHVRGGDFSYAFETPIPR